METCTGTASGKYCKGCCTRRYFYAIGSFKNSSITATVSSGILLCSIPVVISPMYAPCNPGVMKSFACGSNRHISTACSGFVLLNDKKRYKCVNREKSPASATTGKIARFVTLKKNRNHLLPLAQLGAFLSRPYLTGDVV